MDLSKGRGRKSPAKDGSRANQPRGPSCKECGNDMTPAVCFRHDNYQRCVQQNCDSIQNLRCYECNRDNREKLAMLQERDPMSVVLPANIRNARSASGGSVTVRPENHVEISCGVCLEDVPPQPCSEHVNVQRCLQANCDRQQNIKCEKCKQEYQDRLNEYRYEEN